VVDLAGGTQQGGEFRLQHGGGLGLPGIEQQQHLMPLAPGGSQRPGEFERMAPQPGMAAAALGAL